MMLSSSAMPAALLIATWFCCLCCSSAIDFGNAFEVFQDPFITGVAMGDSCEGLSEADCTSSGMCSWCKSAAVPSKCYTKDQAKRLPGGVFQCTNDMYLDVTLDTALDASLTNKKLCDPNVDQKAGYFKLGNQNKEYFFWFFESRNDPSTDPVVLWMTGGPGCSSEVALFAENGPCKVNADGSDTILNKHSWNSKASLIYIDQPAGTGFSFGDHDHNEESVSQDMYLFLSEFMKKYSQFAKNDFYIFGESYAGHYVPATAHRVWSRNKENKNNPEYAHINLLGASVGNGLTDPEIQYDYYPKMAYNSTTAPSRVDYATYKSMLEATKPCKKLIQKCNIQRTEAACLTAYQFCNARLMNPYMQSGYNQYDMRIKCKVPGLCYDFSNVKTYLDKPDVLAYLGVKDIEWQSCSYDVTRGMLGDWMLEYQEKFVDLLGDGIKVLIYAGDVDFICNFLGNEAWTKQLEWPGQQSFLAAKQREWKVNGKSAGLARSHGGLTFLQVYQAGHMVPMDQPEAALAMLNKFISRPTKSRADPTSRSCWKSVQAREASSVQPCAEDQDEWLGMCFPKCSPGYTGKGPLCLGTCPKDKPVSLSVVCCEDEDRCKQVARESVLKLPYDLAKAVMDRADLGKLYQDLKEVIADVEDLRMPVCAATEPTAMPI